VSSVVSHDRIELKDTHYLASWDVKDLPLVRKIQEKIRLTHSQNLIEEFYSLLDKAWDDHRNQKIDPIQTAKTEDIMTWKGIAKICRLITRQDSSTFTYVAVGTGATVAQPYDQALASELAKIDFATNGFFEGSGTSVRYCGTFGESIISAQIKESLVRNQSTATNAIVACRNVFSSNYIDHVAGNSGFSAAGVWEFVPIV
jgi:hypothetical protein